VKFADDSELARIIHGERSEKSYKELNNLWNCTNKNGVGYAENYRLRAKLK